MYFCHWKVGVVFLFLFICTGCTVLGRTQLTETRPNIIVILTDDMDLSLIPYLEKTNKYIAQKGATFLNYFVTSPLCCPSRVSLLRGQYPHNTQILSNSPPDGGFLSFLESRNETETLAVWLNRAGYDTALLGKYLNGYPQSDNRIYIPVGWADWQVFDRQNPSQNDEGNYLNYPMNENGKIIYYGGADDDYSTDVLKNKTISLINQNKITDIPFFILVSVYAPHGPSIPAARHMNSFINLVYPKNPSFNEVDISDKPIYIRSLALSGDEVEYIEADQLYRKRVQTIQAVDDLIEEVVTTLEKNGQLDSTYIFFTSDNGFHIGEHHLPPGKGTPYEEDIHVPLIIRGPGIRPGITITQLVANIDIAPTILEMAHIDSVGFIDGRSMIPLLMPQPSQSLNWRKGLLIGMGSMDSLIMSNAQKTSLLDLRIEEPVIEFSYLIQDHQFVQVSEEAFYGIRTETFKYVEHKSGELEYYDLLKDPYELSNVSSTIGPEITIALHNWLEQFSKCASDICRNLDIDLPSILLKQP